jgi:hypothetical protein
MPGTAKFRDLARDPRFCLHTATVDTQVKDGDAKVWGLVEDIQDAALHLDSLSVVSTPAGSASLVSRPVPS